MTGPAAETNLLVQPLVRVVLTDGAQAQVTLPTLIEHLMADRVASLPALRPHQKHALHAFLVQVGALALLADGQTEPPTSASEWLTLLRGLTPGFPGDEPWSMVVDDLSKPALLQPPVPEGTLEAWSAENDEASPDALDVITKGRQHDLKSGRMQDSELDDWFFALVTLQTIAPQNGAPNKAAARTPSGNFFRTFVGVQPEGGWGSRFKRDISRLMEGRIGLLDSVVGYANAGGIVLLWLVPWDGREQLQRGALDIYYVEVCRRVRLVSRSNKIIARRTGSERDRIAEASGLEGLTGDPWLPLMRRDGSNRPFALYDDGFHYQRVVALLDRGKTVPAPLQEIVAADGSRGLSLLLSGIGIRRGSKGILGGHHERSIPIPPKVVALWGGGGADQVADLAQQRVNDAGTLHWKVLKPALLSLFQNAPEKLDPQHVASNRKAEPYLGVLDREIDRTFFEDLFEELTADEPDNRQRLRRMWLRRLKAHAQDILATAEAGSPLSHVRRYQTRAAAERRLDSAFRYHFANRFGEPAQPQKEDA